MFGTAGVVNHETVYLQHGQFPLLAYSNQDSALIKQVIRLNK